MSALATPTRDGSRLLHDRVATRSRLELKDLLFRAYLLALLSPLFVVLARQPLRLAVDSTGAEVPVGPAAVPATLAIATGLGALGLLALVRTAAWHGPVVLDPADAEWLLASPCPRHALIRPRLARTLVQSVMVGGVLGALVGLLAADVIGSNEVLRGTLGAFAGAGLALVGRAAGWWVLAGPGRARLALRGTTWAAVVLVAAVLAAGLVPELAWVLAWSGPWGWAVLPIAAPVAPAVAGAVLLAVAAAAATRWMLRAPPPPAEELARRSAVGASVAAALFFMDVATARQAAGDARDALLGPSRLSLPPVRSPRLAIVWRDATVALRRPGRLAAGLVLSGASGAGVALGLGALPASGPVAESVAGGLGFLVAAAVCAIAAASALLSPLHSALARPFGHLMLPWAHSRLLSHHLVEPTAALVVGSLAGVGIAAVVAQTAPAWVLGVAPASTAAALWVLATALPLVALTASAALAAPPDPAQNATASPSTVLLNLAPRALRRARPLPALAGPMALLAAAVTAPAAATAVGLGGLTALWGAGASAGTWRWLRARQPPWR